ncbi:MAG: polysaccharide deacetylase family protein, partial [Pseudomonadota bacterium]
GYLSQKMGGAIDTFMCRTFAKRPVDLPKGRFVSLCFDDFPRSAALTAAPMIEAYGWRATWYVAGGFMGTFEAHYGPMFTQMDLRALSARGHDIGCHTFDHVDCSALSREEILEQCERNLQFLKQQGIENTRSFAFPFGAVSLEAKRALSAGALALRGVKPGTNRGSVDLKMLKACGLQANEGGTGRALQELKTLSEQDGWLILFTHDVRMEHSPWGVTPGVYADLLSAISQSGAEVLSVGEMVARLTAQDGTALAA